MEGLAVDLDKSENQGQPSDDREVGNKKAEIAETIAQKHDQPTTKDNQKLPGRDRAEDLVLHVNELGNDELIHTSFKHLSIQTYKHSDMHYALRIGSINRQSILPISSANASHILLSLSFRYSSV